MSGDASLVDAAERFADEDSRLWRWRVPVGLLATVVLLRPVLGSEYVLGYAPYANTILVWMLFAAAFNLLLGYSGLLSFGHAMFLGLGAYGTAAGIAQFELPFLVAAPIGIGLATALAYLIGRIIARKGEIYFAMLTLAFAESFHFVANQNYGGLTGGSTGVTGASPVWIESERGLKYVVVGGTRFDFYFLLAAIFLVAALSLWQIVRSPFGRSLVAVRENEALARSVGIDTRQYKIWAFTFSGLFAAIAGVMFALVNSGANLETLSIQTSGDVILMSVLGGVNYFFGPLFGVFVWLFSESWLTEFSTLVVPAVQFPLVRVDLTGVLSYWQFFLGFIFVVAVLLAPREGLWGLTRSAVDRLYTRLGGERR